MLQLSLNCLWSIVFFGGRSMWGGLTVIALLWLAIAFTIRKFWFISRTAAVLLIPYIAWVSFALILNVSLARLNPSCQWFCSAG
ncbi:MAG: TspO/MBR family protein [Deltaproteobacteria bacterium]